MSKKKRKVRASLRKNRNIRTRKNDLTRGFATDSDDQEDLALRERISGKGALTRKRTLADAEIVADASGEMVLPAVDREQCLLGRVLRVQGLHSTVEDDTGSTYRCATRRLLKTLSTDQRHVVATGDRVWFRIESAGEGIIERVEPRQGVLCRTSRGRQHVIVANIQQMIIVSSAQQPRLKPNLIDRYLITAEKAEIEPVICINKIDLINPADLQPLIGVYSQIGYRVLCLSATRGWGIAPLQALLRASQSVFTGQSGVGKSSLLNAIEPGLHLRVRAVSGDTDKGRHTTSTANLLPLKCGGHVVDTPGIRQFQLWDVIPEEVAGFYRDLRPFVSQCRYPDCTHTHEDECAVKDAVADGFIDVRRYESYVQIRQGDGNETPP